MDFASLMKSQISSGPKKEEGTKKYLKRSEVEAQRQADYQRDQEELEKARLKRIEKKRKRDEEEAERNAAREEKRKRLAEESKRVQEEEADAEERARRKRLGLPDLPPKQIESGDSTTLKNGEEDISEEDLLVKLSDMSEPRYLFGEDHLQRLRRYRKLMAKALAPKPSDGPIPTIVPLVPEAEMKVPENVPKDLEARKFLLRQIASYFDMLLSEWQTALARRSKEVKESMTGKQAFNSFAAARDNLRPLFKKLEAEHKEQKPNAKETDGIPNSLLTPVLEIVHLAQLKRYVNANDAYLRLSIGKAAWPIGVTMVGIHERSAREKLHGENTQAHILSDETTRKMLQGIKRCLSFAQTRWPPDDIGQLMG
ncbi:Pre-mRNA-splicing factor 18 [Fulvia fulva]|uniref:Pre-mRNA-splicing factor 18 n=1 Tax=Passalora fulva TaxID=5499 RepID=A0A9Q8P5R1_PASFU|nr:Pre-mRNA-splicing factor 18 [Fulvia fulva]KAK4631970.1 Pre-mRNA-splicing factor 18 [Fulvia fulva]UJO14263.1 Pre-mRNA-splicing factor 18 [Fulvia fulva]WPV11506.1 Pre-mRNA-splicing factor 18 [Fulvia fulva]WPV26011.1 Pre-mRNA-splicing factor 18 [Fulvia fulva]